MKHHRLTLALLAVAASSTVAAAEITKWIPEVIDGEQTEKIKNPAPQIKVKMIGETMPAEDVWKSFVLAHDKTEVKNLPGVKATRAIPYHRSNETLGIVILVEGHEYYFGNETYRQQPECPPNVQPGQAGCALVKSAAGVYATIRGALEAPAGKDDEIPKTLSKAGPAGSKGALIIYSSGAEKKYEGELKNLTADKLGDQRAQEGKTERHFIDGLRMSADTIRKMGANKKALFIFSDGWDSGAATEIAAIKKKLDEDKVEVFAFHLEAETDFINDSDVEKRASKQRLQALTADVKRSKNQDELKAHIEAAVAQLNASYTLVFPGHVVDPKTKRKAGFKWDGQEHILTLTPGEGDPIRNRNSSGEEIDTTLLMAPVWGQTKGGSLWWLWIVIPSGVILLGVIIASMGKKKPAPAPVPVVVAPAAPAPVAAAPNNAPKTMMVNISTGDGLPVVGWIVPIQGEKQFQTFKLQYGETRIGTTSNAHVVLNDGFMSTDHAKIVMSPTGFTLIDNNSTNGTFANERRIQRHELVDNDMIMFGKTVCKFKTILGT
ncbi:MAG: FHA domain-containing protein [Kofleriaceae bacterium]|jgi:hypothetical protein|nr:FHA domain-containing protein [Kofleriaceae bacterium]MBP9171603.1 FHA domain-containing protein [Kofleriaceae bacterium]MBP9858942.1 FHA domain-containing protein [Kofleriaceae bacterium]